MSDSGLRPVGGSGPGMPATTTGASSATGGDSTATVAADQAKQVASTAGAGAKEVAGEVRQQAGQVAGVARDQAFDALQSAQTELRGHASQQTDRAAQGLRGLAGQIQALVEGRTEEAGAAGDYARQAGERVSQWAGRLEDGGFDGVVDDVRGFARRRPGLFLIGAAAAGFAAGRVIRAVRSDDGNGQDDSLAGYRPAYGSAPTQLAGNEYGEYAEYSASGSGAGAGYASGDYPATTGYPTATDYPANATGTGAGVDDDVLLVDPDLGTRAPGQGYGGGASGGRR